MGTRITFECNLELWRHQQNTDFPLSSGKSSVSSHLYEYQVSDCRSRCSTHDDASECTRVLLNDILNESAKTKILIDYYNKFKTFQEGQRNSLIHLICIAMSLASSFKLERQIKERFQTEKLVSLFFYFNFLFILLTFSISVLFN